jgi:HAD superfamily hydrolase (TIGR01450 family)
VPIDLDLFDAVLLDLDGTVYHEDHALPGAVELIRRLQREGRKFACLTNSTSSPQLLAQRLARMGAVVAIEAIYTAGEAAADYVLNLAHSRPPCIFSLATEGVHDLLDGKVRWVESAEETCDGVLVGTPASTFATESRRRTALTILRSHQGVRLIGICADRVYPSERGIEFGSGALTSMLAYAANATPIYTGKPEPIFFQELCQKLQVPTHRCLLIGDNLESDIAGGKRVGMQTVLSLTGVTRREDLRRLSQDEQPDHVIDDLWAL